MQPSRFRCASCVFIALLIAATVQIVLQRQRIGELQAEIERLRQGIHRIESAEAARPSAEPEITKAEVEQLRKDAADVHRLRAQVSALSKAQQQQGSATKVAMKPQTASSVEMDEETARDPMKRHQLGQKLAREGKFPEALEQFLWCFDEGMKFNPAFVGVRSSFLLNSIKELGDKYPPALDALVARRDAAEATITKSQTANLLSVMEYVRLNATLDDPNRNMTLFDQLPEKHPARAKLVELAGDQFIKANRYQDMVNAGNPEAAFDTAAFAAAGTKLAGIKDENIDAITRRHAVEAGGQGLEALAGAGQIDRAIAFTDKILKFDASPETRGELMKIAERVNNQQLIEHLRAK